MTRPPTTALLLAQALYAEHGDPRDVASRSEIRRRWAAAPREVRLHWLRRARRVLARMQALGPEGAR